MLKESQGIDFAVSPDDYCTKVQEAVGRIEQLHYKMAHVLACDSEMDQAIIAWVNQGRTVQDLLSESNRVPRSINKMHSLYAQVDAAHLTLACARCENPHCDVGYAEGCNKPCSSCGSMEPGKHMLNPVTGQQCFKADMAEQRLTYTVFQ